MANQEFDVVIIDEATQAIEAVRRNRKILSQQIKSIIRSAGFPFSRQRNSS
jgi:hypothetical protein